MRERLAFANQISINCVRPERADDAEHSDVSPGRRARKHPSPERATFVFKLARSRTLKSGNYPRCGVAPSRLRSLVSLRRAHPAGLRICRPSAKSSGRQDQETLSESACNIASATFAAAIASLTSCTRTICAPARMLAVIAAILPTSRDVPS